MKLFKVKYLDLLSGKIANDVVTTEPEFVPGFVIFTLNDRKKIALPSSMISSLEWTFIDKSNPNYDILLLKVSKEK